jgi:dipeptidyl aminopeptidase/acylaminoacyl peptidase
MLKNRLLLTSLMMLLVSGAATAENERRVPTIEELLNIAYVGGVEISPNGKWIAYTVTQADFDENAYVTQIWLADTETKETFQLTRGKSSASSPTWSPDSAWLAFAANRDDKKRQIFAIRPNGGEAAQLTASKDDVSGFEWAPDGKSIAFTAQDAETEYLESRKEHVGDFEVVRREYQHRHLWTIDVAEALVKPAEGERLTEEKDLNIISFSWSPDGTKLAFSSTVNPDLVKRGTADLYVMALSNKSIRKIVSQPGPDSNPNWSPDGQQIVFSTVNGRELYYPFNNELAVVPATGGTPRVLTEDFDEDTRFVAWNEDGIYFQAFQKMAAHLFRLDPETKKITRVSAPNELIAGSFSLTKDGKKAAFYVDSPTTLREVHVSQVSPFEPVALTTMTEQVTDYELGLREVLSWKSTDGTTIEGVLVKPADFNPNKKYPLLCIIHGGPTGIDRPIFRGNRYYPVDIWTGRGALVLRVNYRGSAGYGEAFRTLNMRNLGVGDAWDVLSGVDHLIDKGWVDPERIGCMGWSQGGYISAFLTTSSDKFAAISVGAGISNWATYYYNTDITPFTINYLGDDPADDPEIYAKTSPMSYIKKASTPTLIQHGEFDRRVPIPNGYELRQGLEDRGVPVEMVVYKGFGHGINKPKSQRAVMWHNLAWFNHYLWGDELANLAEPEIPGKDEEAVESKTES